MIASSVIVGVLLKRRPDDPAGVPRHRHRSTRSSRSTSSCWCPSTCCASSPSSLARLVYRFKVRGDEHIPTEGAAILVCNHVSFIDPVLLMAASPRPIRFIMDHEIFKHAGARLVLPPRQGDPDRAAEGRPGDLRAGVRARPRRCSTTATCSASFPKARSRATAQLGEFKGGVMKPARDATRCRSSRWRCRTSGARSSRAPAARR